MSNPLRDNDPDLHLTDNNQLTGNEQSIGNPPLKKISQLVNGLPRVLLEKSIVNKIPNDGILICIICIVLIVVVWLWISPQRKLRTGFWLADADYCKEAGLQYYLLRIGNCVLGKAESYIFASNDQGIIMNNNIVLDFGINPFNLIGERITGKVKIHVLDDEYEEFFLPKEMDYVFYPYYGKFVWSFEDNVMGIFFRNSSMTSVELLQNNDDSEQENDESDHENDKQ